MSKDKGKDKKEKKLKDSEAEEMVLNYINKQNRPYNAQLISDNLHKAVGKSQAQKVLSALADKGRIASKGDKAKIYWKKQDEGEINDDEVKELDAKIASLTSENAAISAEVSHLASEIKGLQEQLTDEDLQKELKRLGAETPALEQKLEALESNTVSISEADRKKAEANYQKMRSAWTKRKRMCKEIIATASENSGKSLKVFQDELSLDTDEDHRVSLGDDLLDQKRKRKM